MMNAEYRREAGCPQMDSAEHKSMWERRVLSVRK